VKNVTASQALLAVAAFLIPLTGGQISTDQPFPLAPGLGQLIRSMFGGPIFQGFETPLLSHFAIGVLIAAAIALSLIQRSVIQLPNLKLAGIMVGFFGILFASVGISEFRFASMAAIGEWLLYALAFFASVAVLGRRDGPRLVLTSLFAGCCLLALYGIGFEYREMRVLDPNYRIFMGWVNPNAAAGILVIGGALGLGVVQSLQRVPQLLAALGLVLIYAALFLTGSKAGLGAAVVCVLVYALVAALWSKSGPELARRSFGAIAVLIIGFGLFTIIQKANQPTSQNSGASVGRIATYNETQAQSLGFRKLLWQGSMELSLKNPTGYGLGTYRYEGSRPGLTTQTQLAHNNILQLAVEASWLSSILLVAGFVLWLTLLFRGAKSMSDEANLLRAGVAAALVATFAHGIFESNLYYFGIGLAFFLLMGVGLCLSADSVAPEFTPRGARLGFAFASIVPIAVMAFFGWAEWQRAQIRHFLQERDGAAARSTASGLVSLMPIDAEAWNFLYLTDPSRKGEAIENAASLSPSPRILRNLAKFREEQGKFASAEDAINRALARDPNNLNTLRLGLEITQSFRDRARAKYYAERMLAVEKSPYFQIRALPQLVDTSTAEARVFLASFADSPQKKADLLQGALDLYGQFAQLTVPEIRKFTLAGSDFGGESAESAVAKCRKGIDVAVQLAGLYREIGETDKSTEAAGKVRVLEGAAASLGGTK